MTRPTTPRHDERATVNIFWGVDNQAEALSARAMNQRQGQRLRELRVLLTRCDRSTPAIFPRLDLLAIDRGGRLVTQVLNLQGRNLDKYQLVALGYRIGVKARLIGALYSGPGDPELVQAWAHQFNPQGFAEHQEGQPLGEYLVNDDSPQWVVAGETVDGRHNLGVLTLTPQGIGETRLLVARDMVVAGYTRHTNNVTGNFWWGYRQGQEDRQLQAQNERQGAQ